MTFAMNLCAGDLILAAENTHPLCGARRIVGNLSGILPAEACPLHSVPASCLMALVVSAFLSVLPAGLTVPALYFYLPRFGGSTIEKPFPLQPIPARYLVPALALCDFAETGFMPQAGEFLALLTVGFLPAAPVFRARRGFPTDARLGLIGCLGLGSHHVPPAAFVRTQSVWRRRYRWTAWDARHR